MQNTYIQETTKWAQSTTPNHTYIMEGSKCVGYIKASDGLDFSKAIMFSKGGFFSKSRRTFKEIKNVK